MSNDAQKKRKKTVVIVGAVFGGSISLMTSILMDFLFADSLTGTWREAIVNDVHRAFSVTLSPDSFIVYILYILVIAFLVVIGAVIGGLFALIVNKFLNFLES